MTTDKPKYQWLSTKNLKVDERYQRTINKSLANNIAESLDWALFGALTVFRRGQQDYIVDGRTRYEGAVKATVNKVPCLIYESRGIQHEAEVFRHLGADRKLISPTVNFRAGLLAKDPQCLKVKSLVESIGFEITLSREPKSRSNGKMQIGCVNTLLRLLRQERGHEYLKLTLWTIREAWGDDPEGTRNEVIHGLFILFKKFADVIDKERLIQQLSKEQPGELFKGSKYISKMKGGQRYEAITDAAIQAYNRAAGPKLHDEKKGKA